MKARYLLFRRTGIYYTEDTLTRKQHGLRTGLLRHYLETRPLP